MSSKNIVFIDSRVADYQSIIDSVSDPAEVFILNGESDGLNQMAGYLMGRSGIDAIHVISHGSRGALYLGSTVLSSDNLGAYGLPLANIGAALAPTGDILLYGCNVAQGEVGQAFTRQFAEATGADVAASVDLTGALALRGNWMLEAETGTIEMTSLNAGSYVATLNYSTTPNYDVALSADLAGLSVAAYLSGDELKSQVAALGWTLVQEISISYGSPIIDAQAVIVERIHNGQQDLAIAFRGTAGLADLITDVATFGFSNYYKALRPYIEVAIVNAVHQRYDNIYLAGHSLGGAAAQIAIIDMLEPSDMSVWTDLLGYRLPLGPLQVGDRFLDGTTGFSQADWDWLRGHLQGVTIGAPSISVDSRNFLNPAFSLPKYKDLLFQFEHKSNTTFVPYTGTLAGGNTLPDDLVASLGLSELGSLVAIELESSIGSRYWDLDGGGYALLQLHSSRAYYESLLRILTDSPLLEPANDSNALPSLITFIGTGTWMNDRILPDHAGNAYGNAGNDILVPDAPGAYHLDGGSGDDAYSINYYGIDATLTGPTGEHLDRLYFRLFGTISAKVVGEDLVIAIDAPPTTSDPGGHSSVTITGWYSSSNHYRLAEIAKIRPTATYWYKEILSETALDIPLLNVGTDNGDHVIGSFSSDSMRGLGGDDWLDGRAGNDLIYGDANGAALINDGNDTIYGGDGNDTIYGGGGNDQLEGGIGDDELRGDAGDDQMLGGDGADTLFGGIGADYLEGGGGIDVLYGDAGNDVLRGTQGDTLYGGAGDDRYIIDQRGNVFINELSGAGTDEVIVNNSAISPVSTRFTVSGNDLLVSIFDSAGSNFSIVTLQGFLANPVEFLTVGIGISSLRYNLSTAWTRAAAGDNVASSAIITSQSNWPWHFGTDGNETLTGTDAANDYLRGYGGSDSLVGNGGNDQLFGMDGDDTLEGGAGSDSMSGDAGNDLFLVAGNSGFDTVDGGPGSDTLNLDLNTNRGPDGFGSLNFSLQRADSGWMQFRSDASGSSSFGGYPTIENLLTSFATSPIQYKYEWGAYPQTVTWKNIETVNVTTSGFGNDVIVYQGGSQYTGGGGTDIFFADFSSWTDAVTWTNGKNATFSNQSDDVEQILGATHQVKVSGMERLLLLTGSGNDTITQQVTGSNDEFRLGAGNDTLNLRNENGESSNGDDIIDLGDGKDILNISGNSGFDTVDGGTGSDTLNLDLSNNGGGNLAFSLQMVDLSWVKFIHNGSGTTIANLLGAFANGSIQYQYSWRNGNPFQPTAVTWKNLEIINVMGGLGSEFIVYQSGDHYNGKGGVDTFFADFSSWTEAVIWTNDKNASPFLNQSDEVVSTLGATHKVKVSGMETLLLLTGSADDVITQNVTNTNDEFRLGAGNDTVFGNNGNDTIDGGAGDDTAVYAGTRASYVITTTSTGFTISSATDGLDTLSNVEFAKFSDQTIRLGAPVDTTAPLATGFSPTDEATAVAIASDIVVTFNETIQRGSGNIILKTAAGVVVASYDAATSANLTISANTLTINPNADLNNSTAYSVEFAPGSVKDKADNSFAGTTSYNFTTIAASTGGTSNIPTAGNDTITGTAGNDTINGLAGNDGLSGGTGLDILQGGAGDDTLDGGADTDAANYFNALSGVVINLSTGTATGGDDNDTLKDIEDVYGSAFADTLIGDAQRNSLLGQGGNDSISAGAGPDRISGGAGNDTLDGGADSDTANYSGAFADYAITYNATAATFTIRDNIANRDGVDAVTNVESFSFGDGVKTAAQLGGPVTGSANTITGTVGNDNLIGTSNNDVIDGLDGDDQISGFDGNDSLSGGAGRDGLRGWAGDDTLSGGLGDDRFDGGAGNDTLDGGADVDLALYFNAPSGVEVNLATGTATGGYGNDMLISIEDVEGSGYADNLVGNAQNNRLTGYGGNDSLSGGAGGDHLSGGLGDDTLDGGTDFDLADYSNAPSGVVVNLAIGTATGGDGNDTLTSMEGAVGSFNFADNLIGDSQANNLFGYGGNDSLNGGAGQDYLVGSTGDDTLDGGADSDRAQYSGTFAGYSISHDANTATFTIRDNTANRDGVDTVTNVETFQFSDGTKTAAQLITASGATGTGSNITGTTGNDSLTGTSGNDTIDGLAGDDTAVFSGVRASYTVIPTLSGYTISSVADGVDILSNVEFAKFSDQTIRLGAPADTAAPSAIGFSPTDEATGVVIASDIVLTFNEFIQRGTGNILLKTAAGVTVAALDAATSSNLSIARNTLTINPTADLAFGTGYRIEFGAGSIKDLAGNAFAGTTSYNFTTVANIANQTFTGTTAADTFTSRPGNDTIDGGAGIDTVAFNGNLSNYTLTKSGSTYTVRAKTGTDGTDTLTNVESLKFTDLSVNLQVKSIAAAAPLADVQRISELYVAFFNRTPDADGLAYWIGQKMAGQSINQIAEAFYNVGASSTFSALTGFSTSMTNEDFLNVFYKNVLGRPEGADAGGLAYWNGQLADGSSTRSSLANDILDSAHTFKGNPTWGWVADLLDNKIAVANTIAVEWGLTYNTDAYARGVAIAAAITPTNITEALKLVGVSAVDFNIA